MRDLCFNIKEEEMHNPQLIPIETARTVQRENTIRSVQQEENKVAGITNRSIT
jgi:hypothetical protein